MSCPNINSREWKDLVGTLGEEVAYKVFATNPELNNVDEIIKNLNTEKNSFSYAINRKNTGNSTEDKILVDKIQKAVKQANSAEYRSEKFKALLESGAKLDPNKSYIGLTTSKGILNKFRQKEHLDSSDYITKQAEELYVNLGPDEKLKHAFSEETLTKEEYIKNRVRYLEYNAYRGKVLELVLTLQITAEGVEKENAKKELEELYTKINEYKEFMTQITGKKYGKMNDNWFDWALTSTSYPNRIFKILGLDVMQAESKTQYVFQPVMKSDILGIRSTLDMLISHGDSRYSIVDFKAGYKFGSMSSSIPLKFYRQLNSDITDNPQNLARLQIMWEALLVRINDPEAVFQNLAATWITEKESLVKSGITFKVDPKDYIGIIEQYLQVNNPTEYETLKQIDPDLFNWRIYSGESTETLKFKKQFPTLEEDKLLNDLTSEVLYRKTFMDYSADNSKTMQDEKIKNLYDMYLEYNPDNANKTMSYLSAGTDYKNIRDLSIGEYWIGSFYNIKHSLVSATLEIVHKQVIQATKEYQRDNLILKSLLKKVILDYAKGRKPETLDSIRNIVADITVDYSVALRKILGSFDQKTINGWIYLVKRNKEKNVDERVMATTKEELEKNAKDNPQFSWILDSSGNVKEHYVSLMNFLNDRYSSILDEERKDSLWNKTLSYKLSGKDNERIEVTYGDEINTSEFRKRSPFRYVKGWFPKVSKLRNEFDGIKGAATKNFFRKYFTNFNELVFDEYGNNDELIPLVGLGNAVSNMDDEYSLSIENQFESFMKAAYAKKYLTPAYAFIEALKVKNTDLRSGKSLLPKLDSWLSAQQEMALRGRRATLASPFSRALPFNFGFHDKDDGIFIRTVQTFNLGKTLQSLGAMTAYIRLGFNVPGGLKNTFGIMFSSFNEAAKQSIMQKLYNNPEYTSFVNDFTTMGAGEFAAAIPKAFAMQSDAMKGNLSSNKAWVLMNKFNYVPSISMLRKETKYFMTGDFHLGSADLAMLPYSTAEEVLIATFFIAQMNHIKVQQGPMKGKSLWDMYEVVDKVDPVTNIPYKDFEYKKDENGNPYVRGVIVDAHGNVTKLTELSNKEVMTMHALYEEKQGGFAQLDRSFIESSILGQVLVQFRRHIQSIIRHGLQSYGPSYIKGKYQNTNKFDADGNLIYEFTPKNIEGKWMTLAGMFLHMIPLTGKIFGKENKVAKFMDGNFPKGLDEYAWNKLDQGQKENVIDAGLNFGMWVVMSSLRYLAFGSNPPPDDKANALVQKVINETFQHWKLWQAYQDISQSPAAFKIFSSLVGGSAQLSMSVLLYGFDGMANEVGLDIDNDDYLTRKGEFEGQNEILKTLPIFTSARTTYNTAESFLDREDE